MIHLTARERIELHAHAAIDEWWRNRGRGAPAPKLPPLDSFAAQCLARNGLITHTGAELLTEAGRRALDRETP